MNQKFETYFEYFAKKFIDHEEKRIEYLASNNAEKAKEYLELQLHEARAIVYKILEDEYSKIGDFEINYCPVCGKDLREEDKK